MRPFTSILSLASLLLVGLSAAPVRAHDSFPDTIQLPNGFRPEGIERGPGHTLFVANFDHGAVFRADARTGAGEILVPARPDRQALGIKLDRRTNHLFVSGGATGHAFVYDASDGHDVADITLTTSATTFINDHVLTQDAVYFTDSFQPVIYRVALDRHGRIRHGDVEPITLKGDFVFTAGQFNANGIVLAPTGKLIVINSFNGVLYSVDPDSGFASAIDTGGQTFMTGDGLVLSGRTLYVVQNTNQISVLELGRHSNRARLDHVITDPRFDVLATAVLFGDDALYVTNPRFGVDATPETPFKVVRVDLE
jgi:hypothetical protein